MAKEKDDLIQNMIKENGDLRDLMRVIVDKVKGRVDEIGELRKEAGIADSNEWINVNHSDRDMATM